MDDECVAGKVVGRRGVDRLHVGAVPRLGHREATRQLHRHRGSQVALVVPLGSQPADHPAKEAVLHADFHQQGEVNERDRLERRERAAHVAFAAVLARKKQSSALRLADHEGLLQHPGAVILDGESVPRSEQLRRADLGPNLLPDSGPAAVHEGAQSPDLHSHLYHLLQH